MGRWLVCGTVSALAVLLFVGSAPARTSANRFPALFVSASSVGVSGAVTLDFNANELDAGGDVERLTLDVPNGYGAALAHADNASLGPASVSTVPVGGGAETDFSGRIVAMSAAAYAASASAQACAPGPHPATWDLQVRSAAGASLSIPIAVDRHNRGIELAMCFDAEQATNVEVSAVEFKPADVFANPQLAGKYLFDATATPLGADGSPSTLSDFEMRAYEDLPSSLSVSASYRRATKTLTVTGQLRTSGGPHSGTNVQLWATQTAAATNVKLLGAGRSGANGRYTITRKLAVAPRYVFTETQSLAYPVCSGASPEPGGCASYSVDAVASILVPVETK